MIAEDSMPSANRFYPKFPDAPWLLISLTAKRTWPLISAKMYPALPLSTATAIKAIFEADGATAKISSIHVNGWFGDYDKLSMSRLIFKEVFRTDLDQARDQVIFCGDSPNDVPMFAFFPYSVGVANVRAFENQLEATPTYVTDNEGGFGFAEMVAVLLDR